MGIATTATSRVNMLACRLVVSPKWKLSVETKLVTRGVVTGSGSRPHCEPLVRTSVRTCCRHALVNAYFCCVPTCVPSA